MKRSKARISLSIFLALVMLVNSISPALAVDPYRHPAAKAPANLKADYQTDLFTGSANYSYPIEVPKGTAGLTPNVSLSYNSSSARDASVYSGMGWDLNRDYIERDVNYTPGSTSDDKFRLRFQGAVHDLVYVSSEGRYHTKIESNLHITKQTSGEENDYNEYWQVIAPDGTKYRFGQSTNSELVCNGRSYVYRWNLDLVTDVHNNKIFYTYSESNGASYLTKIEYNTEKSRAVEFTYGTNPYSRPVYVQGCNVIEGSRLNDIKVKASGTTNTMFSINDKTSSGNNLTNSGGTEYSTSLPFNDSTKGVSLVRSSQQYLSAAHSSSLNTTGNLTIEAWINPTSVPTVDNVTHTIVSKYNDDSSSNQSYIYGLFKKPGVGLGFTFYAIKNGTTNKGFFKAHSISTNTWTHVAMVYTAATKQVEFFVNGTSIGTDTDTAVDALQSVTTPVEIGSFRAGTAEHWDGKLDEVRIWNTTRTSTQINSNKSVELAGSESGLVAYYPFENSGFSPYLVRQFDLGYATASNSGQLLQTITEKGNDGTSSLPATRFDYKPELKSINTQSSTWLNGADVDAHLEKNDVTLADVNGDSLLDIVKSDGNGNNTWKVLLNLGNAWSTSYEIWVNNAPMDAKLDRTDTRLTDVTGDNLPDIVKSHVGSVGGKSTWDVYRNTGSSWSITRERWVDDGFVDAQMGWGTSPLVDVNGDGLTDIVKSHTDNGAPPNWKVYKNTGSTWNSSYENWQAPQSLELGLANVRLLDVNGDGLPDIVKSTYSGTSSTWYVYKNTGTSWNTSPETWINNANIDAHLEQASVALSDVNGDGLVDITKTVVSGSNDIWKVLLNTGNGWSTTYETWMDDANVDSDLPNDHVEFMDVTGDGLPDIVKGTADCSCSYDTWKVWKNNGKASHLLQTVYNSEGGKTTFDYSTSTQDNTNQQSSYSAEYFSNKTLSGSPTLTRTDATINFDWGGGSPGGSVPSDNFSARWTKTEFFDSGNYTFIVTADDGVRLYVDNELILDKWFDQSPTSYTVNKSLTAGNHTVVLEYYENGGGAVSKMNYYNYTGLSFPLWLVSKMTVNNGLINSHGTNDVTTYSYKGGYYKWQEKEFRGFREVNTTEPNGSKKKYVFNQDDYFKGRLEEVQHRNSSSDPYQEADNTWSSSTSNGVTTVKLDSEQFITYDATTSGAKTIQNDYTYDSYGNITKKSEKGDTSITTDDRFIYNEYIYNPSLWIVNRVSKSILKASNDITEVSKTWNYYDEDPSASESSTLGNGGDGSITISSNTTENPIDSSVTATAGSTTVTVGSGLGFAANQIVMFHQTQGTNVGTWEFARVQSYSGTTLTVTNGLANSYSSSGSNKAQVRVVPQYQNVIVTSGVTWSAKAWNGTTGGILAFLAKGTVTVSGTISATGKGYAGAYVTAFLDGNQGEGTVGPGGTRATFANGNGGGGNVQPYGAGGGGYGTAGTSISGGGIGGSSVGTSDLSSLMYGGGGGSGDDGSGGSGGNNYGGNGGGSIFITAANISVTGGIVSNGNNGGTSNPSGNHGGGGGGAGGSILLKSEVATLSASLVTATAGSGGNGYGTGTAGGNGGNGRIRVEYVTSLTGSTNPASSTTQQQLPTLPAPISEGSGNALSKGDLTREVRWLNGGTNITSLYTYDAFGNQISVKDANNHTTTIAYDTSTHTYPISTTNAKNQTTTMSYDFGTGNLLSKIDPNGLTISYEYDVFGRITKEIKPNDSSTYPSTSYTYFFDGIAPEGMLISKRETASSSATLDTYTFIDGLGRKIQTRTDAEDTTKQRVVDTFYDQTGEIKKETVPYLATSSATIITPTPTPIQFDLSDKSTNANNLTNVGASDVTGLFTDSAKAGDFELAESDRMSAVDSSSLKPTGNFTIEAKVKPESIVNGFIFQSWNYSAGKFAGVILNIESDGRLRIVSAKNTGTTQGTDWQAHYSTSTLTAGSTYHVAGVWDGTKLRLYINGVEEGTGTSWTNAPVYNSTNYVRIGSSADDTIGLAANFFDGVIDDVRFWNIARTQTQINDNKNVELSGAESNLGAYYPFETLSSTSEGQFNITDKTTNGNNLTNNGGSQYTTSMPFTDSTKAISLTRSSQQYMSAAHSSSLNTTGNLTIEAWINPASVPTVDNVTHTIVSKYNDNSSANQSYIFGLFKKPGVGLGLNFYAVKNGSTSKQFFKAQSISTNTWTHVAMVYTAASKQVEFFVNGTSIGTDTDTAVDALQSVTTPVEIGSFRGGTAEHWDGKIDEVRIWNTIKTGTQINDNKSVELNGNESGLVAYFPFENLVDLSPGNFNLQDKTANVKHLTNNNSVDDITTTTPFSQSTHATGYLRSATKYLSAADSAVTHFGTNPFTVEMWVYRTADADADEVLIDNRGTTTTSGWVFFINSSDALDSYIGSLRVNTGANTIPLNTWTHVAYVRDGDTLKAYINGVEKGSYSLPAGYNIADPTGGTPQLKIGIRNDNTMGFSGNIDEVRIWNVAKTSTQLNDNKNIELTGSESNLVAYYPMENLPQTTYSINDKTSNGNNLTNTGGSEYSTSLPFTDSAKAVSLVRSSQQYLSAVHSSSLNTTGNLTIEAWINPASVPTSDNVTHTIVSKYNDNSILNQSYIFGIFKKPGVGLGLTFYAIKNPATKEFFIAQSISTNTWTHVAMVYTAASKQVEFFVNGTSIGTVTDTALDALQSVTTPVEIGSFRAGTAEHWDGKIDEVRIWNTTRTQTQINSNKSVELAGTESGLVAYYPFENLSSSQSSSSSASYATYVEPDSSAKYTEFTYDPIGRVSMIRNPKGDYKTIAYDHWKETTIDENGHIKREYKNAFDKIWKVEEVNGINTYTTIYEYDARDLLTKITDHNSNQTTFTYDSLGRKTSQVDPDMGTWSYGYDGVGNLTSQTDNRNVTITKTYDELDRLTLVNYPTQTDNSFAYDIGKIGTLSIATDSAGTVNYSYDNRLRKTQEQRSINGTTKTTQFSYDAMDRLKSQTYPDGEVVNFSFNNQGEIESASGSASLLTNVDYNALGKITKKDFGNGLSTNYTYNTNDFRLSRIQTGSLQDLNYTYDNVGNVASRVNNVTSKTEMFSYDDLDRLKTASESAGYNYAYDYNAIGNLTKFTNAGIDIDYTYGSGSAIPHALTSSASPSATFTYDANGNMTSDGTNCYQYNQANQLDKVTSCSSGQTIAEYVYDYNGNRMVKRNFTNGSQTNSVVSWSDAFETTVATSGAQLSSTSYYFVNNELVAKKNNDGSRNFFHNDHLGSASIVSSQSGALVESTTYDPWGEIKTGGTASKFLYTGQEHDSETGLDYYNARYYNSHIRRFTQADDIIQDPYNPQSLNRYSYVWNNPVRYTDPTGHIVETGLDVAFIAMDLNEIRKDPTNVWNYAALIGDGLGTITPGLTGVGLGVRVVQHGGDVSAVINRTEKSLTNYGKIMQPPSRNTRTIDTQKGKFEVPAHTDKAMKNRQITDKNIIKTINKGQNFTYKHQQQVKTGFYDKKDNIFVASFNRLIKTVFKPKAKEKYVQTQRRRR